MRESIHHRRAIEAARRELHRRLERGESASGAYKSMQLAGGYIPSRATIFSWAKQWREAKDSDTSGRWTLAGDTTGRPDMVMRCLAAVVADRQTKDVAFTVSEAEWIVRLGVALPSLWNDAKAIVYPSDPSDPTPYTITVRPGPLELYDWAVHCSRNDPTRFWPPVDGIEAHLALLYAEDGRYLETWEDPSDGD